MVTIITMALLLQPPPPPQAPLSFSPPTPGEITDFGGLVIRPLEMALDNLVQCFQDLEETPNEYLCYFYTVRKRTLVPHFSFHSLPLFSLFDMFIPFYLYSWTLPPSLLLLTTIRSFTTCLS